MPTDHNTKERRRWLAEQQRNHGRRERYEDKRLLKELERTIRGARHTV